MPSWRRRTRPCVRISPSTHSAVFDGIAKPRPWAMAMIAVLMPTTKPRESTSGPPELPGLIGAACWITFSISRPSRPRIVRPERAHHAGRHGRLQAERTAHRDHELADAQRRGVAELRDRQAARREPNHGEIGRRIVADELDAEPVAVGRLGRELPAVVHDVAIGDRVAVGRDQEAGAAAAAPVAVLPRDADHRRRHGLDDVDHRLRIGVEQVGVARGAVGRPRPRNITTCVFAPIRVVNQPTKVRLRFNALHHVPPRDISSAMLNYCVAGKGARFPGSIARQRRLSMLKQFPTTRLSPQGTMFADECRDTHRRPLRFHRSLAAGLRHAPTIASPLERRRIGNRGRRRFDGPQRPDERLAARARTRSAGPADRGQRRRLRLLDDLPRRAIPTSTPVGTPPIIAR